MVKTLMLQNQITIVQVLSAGPRRFNYTELVAAGDEYGRC